METDGKGALVTGATGLIASDKVDDFCRLGWKVQGGDDNMRDGALGPTGNASWNRRRRPSRALLPQTGNRAKRGEAWVGGAAAASKGPGAVA